MAKIWEKVLSFLGLMEVTEEEEIIEEAEFVRPPARKGAVLNLHSTKNMRLVIIKPVEFQEAQQIVEHIKNRKPVLVNLEETDKNEAKRVIDFIAGATFALDGNMQKVSQQIFVFAPAQVEVNAEIRKELSGRGMSAIGED
ncbi:MAG: cell division protein SepF [Dethiobacter sp.]|nr:cell division protein SepF [Dethiobacter sp.]MBS3900741.1 cell division protein SepF [Dethiobacter sp.]MBS3989648.1 cell division protein SepF [Dethiobacter sp.]